MSLSYTASDFYQNELPDWPKVELQIENCSQGGGNVSQSSGDDFQSYFYRCPGEKKVTPILDICTLHQSLDLSLSCPPAGWMCVRVTDEANTERIYGIGSVTNPSQLISEEMGEGKIKVEFVDSLRPSGQTCSDIFAPSQSPTIGYLYLEVEEDPACGSYSYDISHMEQYYPADPVQFATHVVPSITTNEVEQSFHLEHKFYRISKVRFWG